MAMLSVYMTPPSPKALTASLRAWLQAEVDRDGGNANAFAKRSLVPQSTVSRLLSGETEAPRASTLVKLARAAATPVPAAVQAIIDRIPSVEEFDATPVVGGAADGGIPVWGVHPIEREGEFHISPTPLQILRRHPGLSGSKRIICIYMPDETLAPRWGMGEPVYIDLQRPASTGGYGLFQMTGKSPQSEEESYILRRYDGRKGGDIFLSRAGNEPFSAKVPASRLLRIHHVLSWADLMR